MNPLQCWCCQQWREMQHGGYDQPGENPDAGATVWSTAVPTAENYAPFEKQVSDRGNT